MEECAGPTSSAGLLTFENDLYTMKKRCWAATDVFTVELTALVRLERWATWNRRAHGPVPKGFLKLYNVELLLERIKACGEDYEMEYPAAPEQLTTLIDEESQPLENIEDEASTVESITQEAEAKKAGVEEAGTTRSDLEITDKKVES